jgi:dTMP kinase
MSEDKQAFLFPARKQKPLFMVLEGTDGSGKTEQFKKLVSRLITDGFEIATFDFPQYEKPSSYFVKEYLNGRYGGWEEVGPYRASLFYALDRFDVGRQIKNVLAEGRIVISNRYVGSNLGHQGSKIKDDTERRRFFEWDYDLEYNILGIPRPDLNIFLHMPAVVAQALVDKKGAREYIGGAKRDIHEADIEHLKNAEKSYLEIVKLFPEDFELVECVENGKLLSIENIHQKVCVAVNKRLSSGD